MLYLADGSAVENATPAAPPATATTPPSVAVDAAQLAQLVTAINGVVGRLEAAAPASPAQAPPPPAAPAATPPPWHGLAAFQNSMPALPPAVAAAYRSEPRVRGNEPALDNRLALTQFVQLQAAGHFLRKKGLPYTNGQIADQRLGESHPVAMALKFSDYHAANPHAYQAFTGSNTRVGDQGGVLVEQFISGIMVELLRSLAVVRGLPGIMTVQSPSGLWSMSKQLSGSAAGYIAEGQPATFSHATWGLITFVSKKLAGLTRWTYEMTTRPAQDFVAMAMKDLMEAMALAEDRAFLRSDGSGDEPRGLIWQMAAAQKMTVTSGWGAATNSAKIALVRKDRNRLLGALEDNEINDDGTLAYITAPIVRRYLGSLATDLSTTVFPEVEASSRWGAAALRATTSMPKNLAGDTAELLLIRASDVIIAQESDVRTKVSDSFTDGNGKTMADFDAVGVELIAMHDLGVRRDTSLAMLTDVPWRDA